MSLLPHEYYYPTVTEIPIPRFVPEHDDFADALPLGPETLGQLILFPLVDNVIDLEARRGGR